AMLKNTSVKSRRLIRGLSIFLVVLLVTSGVPFPHLFQLMKVSADEGGGSVTEAVYPGGVGDGLISWVDVEFSSDVNAEGKIIKLDDLAEEGAVWELTPSTSYANYENNAVNFHAGFTASGTGYYRRQVN